jgi:Tol biopolymer transport system component
MTLTAGMRIGAYEVIGSLGAGGMGEVYRATDTKLKRQVAIKILPAAVAGDPERLARFRREAEVLASLNHPNIAAIYGFEDGPAKAGPYDSSGADGAGGGGNAGVGSGFSRTIHALVMELVDGPTLADRIAGGPIPITEALPIAKQIADALEAAHEQGIVHRDLKPANVKVRDDGTVKVLDFGLAKLAVPPATAVAHDLSMSPTITSPAMTQMGVILGTAAYMAPEQARGRVVDKRADIWAFGCVLFEMVTGERPFKGDDLTETLANIVKEQPNFEKAPRQVQRLLRKCLEKDPRNRLRDLGDVWELVDEPSATDQPAAIAAGRSHGRIAWAVAALAVALAVVVVVQRRPAAAVERRRTHTFIQLPENAAPTFAAFAPDGRSVVMTYQDKLGVRSLETGGIRALTGTEIPRSPFWSPDSRTIGFFSFSDRKLKTVPLSGGRPQVLCDDVADGTGTWNRKGTILFAARRLMRVAATGGPCTPITTPPADLRQFGPVFLPDGEHFLYGQRGDTDAVNGLFVASLSDPTGTRVLPDSSTAIFAPDAPGAFRGRLLFVREQKLMAQPFDTNSRQLSGDPIAVADHVSVTSNDQIAAWVADDGTLMYLTNTRVERELAWTDRGGTTLAEVAKLGTEGSAMMLSTDANRIVFRRFDGQSRPVLWTADLEGRQETRLNGRNGVRSAPVLSADGQRIATAGSSASGERGVFVAELKGGTEQLAVASDRRWILSDWSRDGHWFVASENDPQTGLNVWAIAADAGPKTPISPIPLAQTPAGESQGQLSPDGKYLAYTSDESGSAQQVFLRLFANGAPGAAGKWQVSPATTSGREPRWRADGKELFYLDAASSFSRIKLMAVPISDGPNPVGMPKALFEFRTLLYAPGADLWSYAASPDGQRFLLDRYASDAQPTLDVIFNWAWTDK